MKKLLSLLMLTAVLFVSVACYTHTHVVGDGAKGNSVVTERQWWILWGLVPINKVDTQTMAKGAKDYEIKTEQTFVDGIINMFTSMVTVGCQTVEVKK